MLKESAKKSITDFSFLNLLSSTIVLQGKTPIFENNQLQKDLYKFRKCISTCLCLGIIIYDSR